MTIENQGDQTQEVRKYYEEVQRNDRNLALAGKTGIVKHHFGIGPIDWNRYPPEPSQEQLPRL
jgi:hypothetical protein